MRVPCTYLSFRAFPSAKKREHKPTVHMHLFIESFVVFSTHCAVLFSSSVCVCVCTLYLPVKKSKQMLAIILFDGDFLKLHTQQLVERIHILSQTE